jgi:steroid 5-alpha reductase family enzyme
MLALATIAVVTLIPLTLVHPAWCYSVGYGSAVAVMSLAMVLSFRISRPTTAAEYLLYALFLYGTRLTLYLLVRTFSVKSIRDHQVKVTENKPRVFWAMIATVLAVLFACMVSPVLFALRAQNSTSDALQRTGIFVTYIGLTFETIADQQKFQVKRRHCSSYGDKNFVGPTEGPYGMCRHPNYLGEIVYWTELLLGGVSSFGNHMTPWLCGILGWLVIVRLMFGAAKHLDEKQMQNYQGQHLYDEWRSKVKASLIPHFVY